MASRWYKGKKTPPLRAISIKLALPELSNAQLASRIDDRKPVFVLAIPLSKIREMVDQATDQQKVGNWLVTVSKALVHTMEYLTERSKQIASSPRTPPSRGAGIGD